MILTMDAVRRFRYCPRRYDWQYREGRPVPEDLATFQRRVLMVAITRFYRERWWEDAPRVVVRGKRAIVEASIHESRNFSWSEDHEKQHTSYATQLWDRVVVSIRKHRLIGEDNGPGEILRVGVGGHLVEVEATLVIMHKNGSRTALFGTNRHWSPSGGQDRVRELAWGAKHQYGKVPDRTGVWWWGMGDVAWRGVRSLDGIQRWVEQAVAGIASGQTAPTPGGACMVCPFVRQCDEGRQQVSGRTVFDGVTTVLSLP